MNSVSIFSVSVCQSKYCFTRPFAFSQDPLSQKWQGWAKYHCAESFSDSFSCRANSAPLSHVTVFKCLRMDKAPEYSPADRDGRFIIRNHYYAAARNTLYDSCKHLAFFPLTDHRVKLPALFAVRVWLSPSLHRASIWYLSSWASCFGFSSKSSF